MFVPSLALINRYYKVFVKNFATIATFLTPLKKNIPYIWNNAKEQNFNTVKQALTHHS